MRGRGWLVVSCASALLARTAGAVENNYQDFLIGQRAMGMGGAFAAIADDASAPWYNPGGLAFLRATSTSATLGVYGVERREVDRGFVNAVQTTGLSSLEFPSFQTTLSFVTRFGGNPNKGVEPRNGIGISLLVPFNRRFTYSALALRENEAADFFLQEEGRTFRIGPSYARALSDSVSIGFSLFYDYRTYLRGAYFTSVQQGAAVQPCPGTPTFCSQGTAIEATTGSLVLRVGALWKITPRWSLGLAVSAPSLPLHGSANISTTSVSASPTVGGLDVQGDIREGEPASTRLPFEARLGFAYSRPQRLSIAFDVSVHGPLTYDRIETTATIVDPFFVRTVRREPVVNANLGLELFARPYLPLRFGAFTNFSSAPEIPLRSRTPYLPRTHLVGVTASIGYLTDAFGFDFGLSVAYGNGVAQAFDEQDPSLLRRATSNTTVVYFFVSGLGQVIGRQLKKLFTK